MTAVVDSAASDGVGGLEWLTPLLRVALRRFSTVGYHGTSMRDIATDLGMTPAGLYYHYSSKEAILAELLERSATHLYTTCEQARAGAGSAPDEQLIAVIGAFIEFVITQPELALIGHENRSLSEERRQEYLRQRRQIEAVLLLCISDGVTARLFDVEDIPSCTRAVLGMLQSISNWFHPDGALSPADVERLFTRLALQLVGASSAVIAGYSKR
jgi:AcrR family transcriptional regulator